MQNADCTHAEEMTWWQRNKKKILIAAGIGMAAVGGTFIYLNRDAISGLTQCPRMTDVRPKCPPTDRICKPPICSASEVVPQIEQKKMNGGVPFPVTGHIRTLSENRYASPQQIELAKALGISLGEHQTYVQDYVKNCA